MFGSTTRQHQTESLSFPFSRRSTRTGCEPLRFVYVARDVLATERRRPRAGPLQVWARLAKTKTWECLAFLCLQTARPRWTCKQPLHSSTHFITPLSLPLSPTILRWSVLLSSTGRSPVKFMRFKGHVSASSKRGAYARLFASSRSSSDWVYQDLLTQRD